MLTSNWILKLAYRLGFDLSDPLAGYLEDASDFLQRVRVSISQPVPQFDDFAFTKGQRFEQVLNFAAQDAIVGLFERILIMFVLYKFAERTVVAITHRSIETDGMSADVHDSADLVDGYFADNGNFFHCGRSSIFVLQRLLNPP